MKFIDIRPFGFVLEPRYYFFGWSKEPKILARKSALSELVKARSFLPKGYNFKVWDFQRPRSVQLAMLDSFSRRFKIAHPKATKAQIEKMVFTFGAKPLPDRQVTRPDCHRNGGAVDLTIVDKNGNELYMGTDHDDLTKRAATNYFETKKHLTASSEEEAKKNRQLLIKVMTKAGWDNYAPEWWHWSTTK